MRAHVLLCMLAYHLAWHLRQACLPLLFDDEHPRHQPDPGRQGHPLGLRPAQGFTTIAPRPARHAFAQDADAELATQTRNTIRPARATATFDQPFEPTLTHARASELIDAYTITT